MASMKISTPQTKRLRGPGRPREFDMDAALDGAILVFREKGYHAASVADLSAAMRLTAGSLYKAFIDKRGIFLAAYERYTCLRHGELGKLLARETSGRDKILAMLRFYAESSHGEEGRRGCLVAGSAMALTTFDQEVAARVEASIGRVELLLRDLLRLGRQDGSVRPGVDIDATANCLLCLLQGFRVIGKRGRSRGEMMAAADEAMRMLA